MAWKMLPAASELFPAIVRAGTATPPRPQPPAARNSPSPTVHRHAPPAARLGSAGTVLVVDVDGALLLSRSLFPYFMLVALEAGSFLRGLVLLLLYPAIRCCYCCLGGGDLAVRAMAAVAFCGLRARTFRAGRAVLPRWLLEDVAAEALEAARRVGDPARVVWASAMPRVMVEPFLREYLQVPAAAAVAAREMKTAWGFYTGLMEGGGEDCEATMALMTKRTSAGEGAGDVVGFSAARSVAFLSSSPLASTCKEVYVVCPEEKSKWRRLARRDYPTPLVFHDGRLAFLPTPLNTVAMFTWLPLGAALAILRLAVALALPYKVATALLAATGQSWRLRGSLPPPGNSGGSGQLYACNHRTLIDPVYVSIALDRPVRAVSYSLSRVSDLISPIGATVRLARDRARDGAAMARLLARGDSVVVCPEGTTCREPYLLRFSPLFAELGGAGGVVPVALAAEASMFYGTTASGWKAADPFYFLCNPRVCYTVQFLKRVDTADVAGDGKKKKAAASSVDVANRVQRLIADALGYECTMLTRKDKYLMLVGNDGAVAAPRCRQRQVTN
ncbi:probable glycerol-3-phosphate acyltransferase 3 [Zea mays]|uniref:Phospholipid/glycerol acyltransferase domain-containing protein n=2 Tax=Zea mays TaxID=4577 RepID=A0A804N5M1_MAIZE|nr:probable glycerol-3-phosphate acyltransferase 3 [Zea mays]|eukprot:XP_020406715.1 probable glycerol-3-phosphate acyltransferase 3 [Zea mays]